MKLLTSFACCLFAVAVQASVRDGAAEFDRTAAESAARLVLDSLADDMLVGGGPLRTAGPTQPALPPAPGHQPPATSQSSTQPALSSLLRDAMLADPAANADPAVARQNLTGAFTNALADRYSAEARRVLARLAGARAVRDAFSTNFLAGAAVLPPSRLAEAKDKLYPGAFETARRAACADQAATLVASVRPSEAEVDALPRERLREELTRKIAAAQKTAVFRENLGYISEKIAGPVLDDAFAQREEQAATLRRARADGWAPAAVESNLVAALFAAVADRRAKADAAHPAYGVFPSMTNAVARDCAEKRVLDRFTDRVADAAVPVDPDSVLREIEHDPAKHVRRADSLKAFDPVFRQRVLDAAFAAASAAAPVAERDAFGVFVRAHEKSPAVSAAVAKKVEKDLLPAVEAVRAVCAEKQFRKTYPSLADGTWCPDAGLADKVCDRPDYKTAVARWRSLDGLEDLSAAAKGHALMEEAATAADKKVAAAFDLARAARTAQQGLIDNLYPAVLASFRESAAAGKKPALKDIVADYTDRAAKGWTAARPDVLWKGISPAARPKNAEDQHADLFPSAHRRIELLAKSVMEALKEEKPEEKKPTPATVTPPDQLPLRDMGCVFTLSRHGGEIVIGLAVDGTGCGEFTCPAEPDKYSAAAPKTLAKASAVLAARLKDATKTNRIALKADILVKDGFVYYGTVRALSDAVQSCALSFGTAVSSCDIGDSLSR